jgi:hypothetical protein
VAVLSGFHHLRLSPAEKLWYNILDAITSSLRSYQRHPFAEGAAAEAAAP